MPRPTKQVEIQEWQPGNDFDGLDGEWVTVETVPAFIKPLQGREVILAGVQIESLHDYTVTIRRLPWLTTNHRLIGPRNEILNIASRSSDRQRSRWWTLQCTKAGILDRERAYSVSSVSDFVATVVTSVPSGEDGTTFILSEDGNSVVLVEA